MRDGPFTGPVAAPDRANPGASMTVEEMAAHQAAELKDLRGKVQAFIDEKDQQVRDLRQNASIAEKSANDLRVRRDSLDRAIKALEGKE